MTGGVVILGAGQAGAAVATGLRAEGVTAPITLIGAEPHDPYERPPLSKAVLIGTAPPGSTTIVDADNLRDQSIQVRLGCWATSIDRTGRRVTLADGSTVAYDHLVLTLGGRARPLSVPGGDHAAVHTLRTIDDAKSLASALAHGRRLVVIGGGWIGLEVAASARAMGLEVAVVEQAEQLCPRTLSPEAGAWLADLHRRRGVTLHLGAAVTAIEDNGGGVQVCLSDGQRLPGDVLVPGIGLLANDDLARDAGLDCSPRGGVLVDEFCRTSDPDILAAGDIAVMRDLGGFGPGRLESWQNAMDQGAAVARVLAGSGQPYRPTPLIWSEQFNIMIQIAGLPGGGLRTLRRNTDKGPRFLEVDASGRAVAAVTMDGGRDFLALKSWVVAAAPVEEASFLDSATPLKRLRV